MARRATRTVGGRGTEQSRILSAVLEFGLDEQQHETFKLQTAAIKQQLVEVDEHVKRLNQSLEMGGATGLVEGTFGYAWLNKQFMDAEDHAASLETQLREGLNVAITEVQENLEASVARTRDLATQVEEFGAAMAQRGAGMLGLAFPGQFVPLRALESMVNINAMMTRYLDKVGLASEEGRRWALAQERIEESQLRIGQVASEALIPFMERVADLAEAGAQFVEEHPDLIRGFVTVGGILVSAGTLATVLSKGVSLVADAKTLLAGRLQDTAANKQLAAAQMQSGAAAGRGVGAAVGGLGGLAGTAIRTVGTVALIATAVYIGAEVVDPVVSAIGEKIYGEETWEEYRGEEGPVEKAVKVARTAAATAAAIVATISTGIQEDLFGAAEAADKARERAAGLIMALAGVSDEAEKTADKLEDVEVGMSLLQADVDAYINYLQRVTTTDKKFHDDRLAIWEQAGEELLAQEESYQERRQAAIQQLQDQWAAEDEARAWSEYIAGLRRDRAARLALEQHLEDMAEAEADYQERRQEIIEDHQEALQDMEEDHLETLEDMQENYEFSQEETIRARDAIGYLRNLRNYQKQVADEEERYQEQIVDSQEQHQDRLDESEEQHREMMQQKQEQWDERLEAEREQAEFERMIQDMELRHRRMMQQKALDEQLAAMLVEHREEMAEIRRQRIRKLNELQEWHTEERNALNQQLADVLFDELQLKADFYAQMEEDAIAWMRRYQYILHPSQYVFPEPETVVQYPRYPDTEGGWEYQRGGYAREGMGQMHAGEFVLSPETTSMAERLAGGMLTQRRLLEGMGGRSFVVQQTGWSFAPGMGPGDRAWFRQAAKEAAFEAYQEIVRG